MALSDLPALARLSIWASLISMCERPFWVPPKCSLHHSKAFSNTSIRSPEHYCKVPFSKSVAWEGNILMRRCLLHLPAGI